MENKRGLITIHNVYDNDGKVTGIKQTITTNIQGEHKYTRFIDTSIITSVPNILSDDTYVDEIIDLETNEVIGSSSLDPLFYVLHKFILEDDKLTMTIESKDYTVIRSTLHKDIIKILDNYKRNSLVSFSNKNGAFMLNVVPDDLISGIFLDRFIYKILLDKAKEK